MKLTEKQITAICSKTYRELSEKRKKNIDDFVKKRETFPKVKEAVDFDNFLSQMKKFVSKGYSDEYIFQFGMKIKLSDLTYEKFARMRAINMAKKEYPEISLNTIEEELVLSSLGDFDYDSFLTRLKLIFNLC